MNRKISLFQSIRFKIFSWFIFIAILPMIYLSYTNYTDYEHKLKAATLSEVKQASSLDTKFINNWFSYRIIDISTWSQLKANIDLLKDLSQLHKKSNLKTLDFINSKGYSNFVSTKGNDLILLSQQYDYIYDLFLIDLDGNILLSVAKEDDLGRSFVDGKYKNTKFAHSIQQTIKDKKLHFSDLERYAPSNDLVSGFMTAPLIDDDGKAVGVFAMQFHFNKILNLFEENLDDSSVSYYLVGEDGYLRSKISSGDELLSEDLIVHSKQYNMWKYEHIQNSQNHSIQDELFIEYINPEGNLVFGIHQGIDLLGVKWVLISEINTDIFVTAKSDYLIKTIIYLIFIIFGIAMVAYIVSIQITKPIDILLKATNDYASGNRDIDVDVLPDSKSEIGYLGQSFGNMIELLTKNENELIEKGEQALEAAKSKSEFLASMSHEIRTPMNGVIGMLSLLKQTKLNDVQKHHTHLALSSATALLALINDILDFSKVEAGKLELDIHEYDVRCEIGDFAEAIAFKAQDKGVELILDLSGVEYDKIEADSGRIRQILTNIVGNSIKFTKEGYILIEISLNKLLNKNARLNVKIIDSGIGIPKGKIDTLFDSFTQVDSSTTRQYGGTGLGLSIVKKLCELMDGDIKVTSAFGHGSIFEFNIGVKLSNNAKIVVPKVDVRGKRVLIIDDEIKSINAIKNQLEYWNMDVEFSTNSNEALDMCSEEIFDIILLDVNLENVDTKKLVNDLRKFSKNENIKLVMMTPLDFNFDSFISYDEVYFDEYFPKPTTTKDYMRAFDVLLQTKIHKEIKQVQKMNNEIIWPKNTKILLVEDNLTNQIVAQGILETFGLNADVANNGAEAIMMIRKSEEAYSIVLMDCQMPVMDGYEATTSIREGYGGEKNEKLPIIAMTANAMAGDKEKCFSAGMDDYITKPIDIEKFKVTLKKWLSVEQEIEEDLNIKSENKDELLVWDKQDMILRLGGSKDLIKKVIKIFLEEIYILSDKLKVALKENKKEDIKLYAHTIKGSAGNLSASKLQTISKEIEYNLSDDYDKLICEVDILVDVFNKYIDEDTISLKMGKYDKDLFISSLKELKLLLEYGSYIDTNNMWVFSLNLNSEVDEQLSLLYKEINNLNEINSINIIDNILKGVDVDE